MTYEEFVAQHEIKMDMKIGQSYFQWGKIVWEEAQKNLSSDNKQIIDN